MASTIAGAYNSDMAASGGLLSAFKSAFGGNTKAMAQALGQTQRSVQRYFTSGAQKRSPSKATRAKMAQHINVVVKVSGTFVTSKTRRQREVSFAIDADHLRHVIEGYQGGDDDAAYEEFWEEYGFVPDDIEQPEYTFSPG